MVTATRTVTLEEIDALQDLLATRAFRRAPEGQSFTLASGLQSQLYFESKYVTLSPEGFLIIGKMFRDEAMNRGATAVGGLAVGSVPITMAVVACEANAKATILRAFYVRSEPKEHGTKESLFQSFDPADASGPVHEGTKVLVVDDVLTTGKSISLAMEGLGERKVTVTAIAVLVDRSQGGATNLREKYHVPVVAMYKADSEGKLTFHGKEVS